MSKIFKVIKDIKKIRKDVKEWEKTVYDDIDKMSIEELQEFIVQVEEYKEYHKKLREEDKS